jgi:NTE family protein
MHLDDLTQSAAMGSRLSQSPGQITRGLVLMGGGARAAYQAGVLQALAALLKERPVQANAKFQNSAAKEHPAQQGAFPFQVLVGTSAGALNATYLASRAIHGLNGLQGLGEFWHGLHSPLVYHLPDTPMAKFSRWATALGVTLSARKQGAALDSMPLVDTLHRRIQLNNIELALTRGDLKALAVTASSYTTGVHWTFCQTHHLQSQEAWNRPGRRAELQDITIEHLMASSAIPFLFPATPLWVDGNMEFFGDGSMRQSSPLSPAVHLGANKILAIGVGQPQRASLGQQPSSASASSPSKKKPSLGNIAGHAMASVFNDTLLADVEQVQRVNRSIQQLKAHLSEHHSLALAQTLPFREVEVLAMQPSESLDALAQAHVHELPRPVHRVLEGLGALKGSGASLASYLLFEPGFLRALMALGALDVAQRKDELLDFFSD